MILTNNYEIVEIAGEYLAIPVGDMAINNRDVFSFSKAASFLIKQMSHEMTKDSLIDALVSEYQIDRQTASKDVAQFIASLSEFGLIKQQ